MDLDVSPYLRILQDESGWHTDKQIVGGALTCQTARDNVVASFAADVFVRASLQEGYSGYAGVHWETPVGVHLVIVSNFVTGSDITATLIHEAQHHGGHDDEVIPEKAIQCFKKFTTDDEVLEPVSGDGDDDNNNSSSGGGGGGEDDENCQEAGGQGCEHGTSGGGGEESTDDEEEESTGTVTIGDTCVPCAAHPNWPNCCGSGGCQ